MNFRLFLLLAWLLPIVAQAGLLPERTPVNSSSSALIESSANDEFLKPEQAFKLSVQTRDAQTLLADFEVTPGYYLYRERISFKLKDGSASSIASIELPKGEMKHDASFGEMEVYHQSFQAVVKLQHAGSPPSGITLLASYQGCSEKGLCYAPIRKTFDIALNSTAAPTGELDQIKQLLGGGKLWLIAAGFFGFGLLLSFTPCVFPMIPILSGIIVGQGVPVYSEGNFRWAGKEHRWTRRLHLPLTRDGKTIDMVLAGQVFEERAPGGDEIFVTATPAELAADR